MAKRKSFWKRFVKWLDNLFCWGFAFENIYTVRQTTVLGIRTEKFEKVYEIRKFCDGHWELYKYHKDQYEKIDLDTKGIKEWFKKYTKRYKSVRILK